MTAALEKLFARERHGIRPGLAMENALLERLGRPEQHYAVVHVAGSNGKGSVCAMLAAMFQAVGIKTGLYTSPHLVAFNERYQVNGIPIDDPELDPLVARIENVADAVAHDTGQEATFFECATAVAFEWFAQTVVRIAVIETGMGGRLDATNVVDPLVCAITGISLEHTAILGKDIASIAREKGGIVKPGRPLVCGENDPDALAVFETICREQGSPIILSAEAASVRRISHSLSKGQKVALATDNADYGTVTLPLHGRHQLANLAVAVLTVERALDAIGVGEADPKTLARGIARTVWPARFQVLETDPPVILDGAHNPGAAKVLAGTVKETLGDRPFALVAGFCDDKDMVGFLKEFPGHGGTLWAVLIANKRARAQAEIAAAALVQGWTVIESDLPTAISDARAWAKRNGGVVLIAGSLYLAGETLQATGRPWPYA